MAASVSGSQVDDQLARLSNGLRSSMPRLCQTVLPPTLLAEQGVLQHQVALPAAGTACWRAPGRSSLCPNLASTWLPPV
jgi:hypothetical protein